MLDLVSAASAQAAERRGRLRAASTWHAVRAGLVSAATASQRRASSTVARGDEVSPMSAGAATPTIQPCEARPPARGRRATGPTAAGAIWGSPMAAATSAWRTAARQQCRRSPRAGVAARDVPPPPPAADPRSPSSASMARRYRAVRPGPRSTMLDGGVGPAPVAAERPARAPARAGRWRTGRSRSDRRDRSVDQVGRGAPRRRTRPARGPTWPPIAAEPSRARPTRGPPRAGRPARHPRRDGPLESPASGGRG